MTIMVNIKGVLKLTLKAHWNMRIILPCMLQEVGALPKPISGVETRSETVALVQRDMAHYIIILACVWHYRNDLSEFNK